MGEVLAVELRAEEAVPLLAFVFVLAVGQLFLAGVPELLQAAGVVVVLAGAALNGSCLVLLVLQAQALALVATAAFVLGLAVLLKAGLSLKG